MLQNAYFLAKIGADTAENEQHLAEILPKTGTCPTRPPRRGPRPWASADAAEHPEDPPLSGRGRRQAQVCRGVYG